MLFQAIRKSLEFPKTSPIVQQSYIDFLAKTYRLNHNGDHGLEHWMRVLINGRLLSEQNGADLEVVEHFALLHDVKREHEGLDLHHGPRAAEFIKSIAGTWLKLSEYQLSQLIDACRYHSVGRIDSNITVQTCWDADRLDIGRVGVTPKPSFLGSSLAKDINFIELAFIRSKKRFVLEDFVDD